MSTRAVFALILFLKALTASSQRMPEKGVPLIQNFTPEQYQNKGKIWDICSSPNGLVYMAADKGLLEYDGKTWRSYVGSDGFTRSLLSVNDSLLYTGSDLDFGTWNRGPNHRFEYQSLYPFREELRGLNEEFWGLHLLNENVFFVSAHNLYVYKNRQLTKIPAPHKFTGSYEADGYLYLTDEKSGLYQLDNLSLKWLASIQGEPSIELVGVYQHKADLLLVSKNAGLYRYGSEAIRPLDIPLSRELKAAKVFSFERIDSTHLAFGTVLKGLFITDLNGNIIHRINRNKGLPNNTILSLHYSPSGKLWMGLDYGVASLDLHNSRTYFYDFRGDFGTGSTALLINDQFYLGTNQGLYTSKWQDLDNSTDFHRFQLVPGTEGQVWALKNIEGQVLIGHDKGLFTLKGSRLQKLGNQQGIWSILQYGNYLLVGTYNGIGIYSKLGDSWVFQRQMELILGSCNQIMLEQSNTLWVNIPNFGIIRAILNEDLYPVERNIFTKNNYEGDNLHLRNTNGDIWVITDRLQYRYDAVRNKFMAQPKTRVADEVLISGVFQQTQLNDEIEFLPVYNGFAFKFLDNRLEKRQIPKTLILRTFEVYDNQERHPFNPGEIIPAHLNNIHIEYIVPNQERVQYQYQLGKSGNWSGWSSDNFANLISLSPGEHQISVRAVAGGDTISTISLVFRVDAPWHKSWYASILYLFLTALAIGLAYGWQRLSLKRQKRQMLIKQQKIMHAQTKKYQQKISLLEQERLQVENEQIKKQLRNKTIELATKAKENEDKNRLLLSLKEKMEQMQNRPYQSTKEWGELYKLLDTYKDLGDNTFEIQMDDLHQAFFKKLKNAYPSLSNNDLRLCAYLKIGLNSKEIADMLNILPSSVFISRSRLRKKLNLSADEDLQAHLNAL